MILDGIELIPFQDLNQEEKLIVLAWRNHDNVRKWMYNSAPILEKNHLSFVKALVINNTSKYFLVVKDKKKIGVIYFIDIDNITRSSTFGLYANPEIKGVGTLLISTICSYAFEYMNTISLKAEVFESNERAISLYEKNKFIKTNTMIVDGKKIINMERIK